MILLPETDTVELDNVTETSKTYRIVGDRIQGFITDGIEIMNQAIHKVLNTQLMMYEIYSFEYGIDFESLIGKDSTYVGIEIKRRIEDCLLDDDRISSIDNFEISFTESSILVSFDVTTIYGDLTIEREVTY